MNTDAARAGGSLNALSQAGTNRNVPAVKAETWPGRYLHAALSAGAKAVKQWNQAHPRAGDAARQRVRVV